MKLLKISVGIISFFGIFKMNCEANSCNELKSRRESAAIIRYHDSSRLAMELSNGFSGVGTTLALSGKPENKRQEESPFKGLYVLQSKPTNEDSLLDCGIGKTSAKYAQLVKGGVFASIKINDIVKAKGKPANWNDLRVFMDLGIKLQTPKSLADLKRMLEKESVRIDTEFSSNEKIIRDPWFGVFYKETNLKSYIYGIKYIVRNDTLEYLYHKLFFGFRKSDFLNNYLDGASAVYIMDTVAYNNVKKLESFILKAHE